MHRNSLDHAAGGQFLDGVMSIWLLYGFPIGAFSGGGPIARWLSIAMPMWGAIVLCKAVCVLYAVLREDKRADWLVAGFGYAGAAWSAGVLMLWTAGVTT
jgi:hypothetical protein